MNVLRSFGFIPLTIQERSGNGSAEEFVLVFRSVFLFEETPILFLHNTYGPNLNNF